MAGKKKGAQKADIAGGAIDLLEVLAVRGRSVQAVPDDGTDDQIAILSAQGIVVARTMRSALRAAERRGWIGAAGGDGRLGLTTAGRAELRRARSHRSAMRAQLPARTEQGEPPSINPAESPLTWLASRRDGTGQPLLTAAQLAAGERLRADLYAAQLTPRVTMSWSGLPSDRDKQAGAAAFGGTLSDHVVAARLRVTAALWAVGPGFSDILIDICGHLRGLEDVSRAEGWPRRAARLLLQRGLSALARHYGLEPPVPVEETIARRLRHWGAEDYRPSLTREGDGAEAHDD